ncbi:PLD nuclease N-terminal domain-containing protein [Tomitella biformata]|uniref:PLD nuclease N-terminal domain-containing protein n=1 Tax=Tomitella biformata TaxID=630403 RepID=UPI0004678624|nr:PLD nuclease N-terminal domain-containing protein [Tomitella biformata]
MPYLGLLIMALWLFSLIDAITADDGGIRHLPKAVWVIAVLLVPLVGSLAWLFLGRPVRGPVWGGGTGGGAARRNSPFPEYETKPGRYVAQTPEADAEFLRQCRARAEEQRRIERDRRRAEG